MQFAFATAILKIETLRMRRRFARVSLITNFLAYKFASTKFNHITLYVVKFTRSTVFCSVKAKKLKIKKQKLCTHVILYRT